MGEREECERLFMDAAPFVLAESAAEDALEAAQATLKTARVQYRAAEKAAAIARATWVENLLKHNHRETCYQEPASQAPEREGE